jgi:hypothetical protein
VVRSGNYDARVLDDQVCDELQATAAAGDWTAFQLAVPRLAAAALDADAARAGHLLDRIVSLFASAPTEVAGPLSVVAGALVEHGAPAEALVAPVVAGLSRTLSGSVEFAQAWGQVGTEVDPPPADGEQEAYDAAIARLSGRRGFLRRLAAVVTPDEAARLAGAWFSSAEWALAASALLTVDDIRVTFPERRELTRLVARLAPIRPDLRCLGDLLVVLDDEPMIVLHRPTGRGWIVRVSGVGDNFQLQTLLADVLSGDPADGLLDGVAPEPSWVLAASTGPFDPGERIEGRFNLVDGFGKWISNEARPADIPVFQGWRVVVLDPPPYVRTWEIGRRYPAMRPQVRIEELMPDEAATRWLDNVAAAEPAPDRVPAQVHLGRETVEITA